MTAVWLILLIFDILIYAITTVLILKRRKYTSISIRSPILLILNNLGTFFMSLIIIIIKMIDKTSDQKNINYPSGFYYLTHIFIIVPFILRCQRLLVCCQLKTDEQMDLQQFYNKKYLYGEKFYMKIFIVCLFSLTVIFFISNFIGKTIEDPYAPNFITGGKGPERFILFLILIFVENLIILTYTYKICVYQLKQKLRFECVAFFIIWFIYSNIILLFDYLDSVKESNNNKEIVIGVTIVICYLCLIIQGFLPVLLSYTYKYSIGYHFTPKLMNNLYLFLSNETCYSTFKKYIISKSEINRSFLEIYSLIMNYKLGYVLQIETEQQFQEARTLYNTYFANNTLENVLGREVVEKVRNECKGLEQNLCTSEMFDEALVCVFNELGKLFNDFRKTSKYRELYEELYLDSYIQCKMCNVGLIDKF